MIFFFFSSLFILPFLIFKVQKETSFPTVCRDLGSTLQRDCESVSLVYFMVYSDNFIFLMH